MTRGRSGDPEAYGSRVSPETAQEVLARDGWTCQGPAVGMPGACDGPLELDHILNGGMSLRGPSTRRNLVTLCRHHHRTKTEGARTWRPKLTDHVARTEDRRSPT